MVFDAPRDAPQASCVRRRSLGRRGPLETDSFALEDLRPLWFVTVTLSGRPLAADLVHDGLQQLNETRAFLVSTRYDDQRAEVRYWDEGATARDTTRQALALWRYKDVDVGLPGGTLSGLVVVDRAAARREWLHGQHPTVVALGEVVPFDDRAQLA